jgi:hypothetical protein
MSDRDQDPPSHDEPTPGERDGEAKRPSPAPGKTSRVERYYGMIQRRHLDGPRDPEPRLTAVPGSAMPDDLFDAFSLHLDPVQREAEFAGLTGPDPVVVHAHAARGLTGAPTALPHGDAIQRSFGPDHDVSSIRAHVGGPAAEASAAIGATAYATGDSVAFASAPDLHTAAHEAAHIVQQRAGVQLYGGVGQAGDPYEQHADAVADRVVRGESAADLLASGPSGGPATGAVQRKGASEAEVSDLAARTLTVSDRAGRIAEATAALEIAKAKAERALARWQDGKLPTADAAREVIQILGSTIEPISALKAGGAHQAAMPNAIRSRDTEGREEGAALGSNRPVIFDALNNLARVALTLEASRANASRELVDSAARNPAALAANLANLSELDAMARMLDSVATIAKPIGWSPPTDLAQANVVRFAYEACPSGSADERPEACSLDDARRVEARFALRNACTEALGEFVEASRKIGKPLERMIAKTREAQSQVIDIAIGLMEEAIDVAIPGMPGVGSLVLGQLKDEFKDHLEAQMHAEPTEGEGTMSMLTALRGAVKLSLETLTNTAKHLDDEALLAATRKIQQLNAQAFITRLAPVVAAYGAQIDPIGRPRTIADEFGLFGPAGTWDAIRVRLPTGGLRPALVVRGTRPDPKAKNPALPHPAVTTYDFVRWIDAQFGPMVAGAPIVELGSVNGLPLGEILAP